jgi:hypothetical protein
MTNGNDVTHNTKHTILFNKTKFTPYSVPPAHVPASVFTLCLPGGTEGYPAYPRLIRLSVCPSVMSLLIFLQIITLAQQIW